MWREQGLSKILEELQMGDQMCCNAYLSIWHIALLSDRYDLCQHNTEWQKPYCFSKHWKRIGWSTVSKAADKSINTSNAIICCSILCKILAWTLSKADSVEWPCLYAEDIMGNEQLCSMYSFCCDITAHSEILDTNTGCLLAYSF